ncbi:MAG: FeoB-associated Cys-rich membrane protein [Lawsonibacter sp.]
MPISFGELLTIFVLAAIIGLAVRSLWKTHKQGRHCNGDCSRCGSCHGK